MFDFRHNVPRSNTDIDVRKVENLSHRDSMVAVIAHQQFTVPVGVDFRKFSRLSFHFSTKAILLEVFEESVYFVIVLGNKFIHRLGTTDRLTITKSRLIDISKELGVLPPLSFGISLNNASVLDSI